MADEGAVDMDEPRDPGPEQTTPPDDPACTCGSHDHPPLRIGDRLSPSGGTIGPVYVCPAESPVGLRGVL
jgi:hypothetical protein